MRSVPKTTAAKLMAAAEIIAERGLDNTKIEDLATATGVPKATLYYYFEGKEEILSFIFGVVIEAVRDAVARGVSSPGTAAERFAKVVEEHVGVFRAYPAASQVLHFDLGRATRRPELASRIRDAYIEPVTQLLADGAADGSLRRLPEARLTAVAVLGATSTTAVHVLAIQPTGSIESLSKVIVPLVLDGLRAG